MHVHEHRTYRDAFAFIMEWHRLTKDTQQAILLLNLWDGCVQIGD